MTSTVTKGLLILVGILLHLGCTYVHDPSHVKINPKKHEPQLFLTARAKPTAENELELTFELRNLKVSDVKSLKMRNDPLNREPALSESRKGHLTSVHATWKAQKNEWGHLRGSRANFRFDLEFWDGSKSDIWVRRNKHFENAILPIVLIGGAF